MQPPAGKLFGGESRSLLAKRAEDANTDASRPPLVEDADHHGIGELGVVEKKFLARTAQEDGESFPGIHRTDQESLGTRRIGKTERVRLKQLDGLADQVAFLGHEAEAAALVHVKRGVVEAKDVELRPIHDHDLVVVAAEIVVGAAHARAGLEQTELELPQPLVAPAIRVGDEGADGHASRDRGLKGLRHIAPVEPEDADVEAGLRLVDGGEDRADAVFRFDDQAHFAPFFGSQTTSTASAPWSAAIASEIRSVFLPWGTSAE